MTTTVHERYASHRWVGQRTETDYGPEWLCYCKRCGCPNLGDPAEFPDIDYLACGDEAD